MARSTSRLCPEVKTFKVWSVRTRARAADHPDSATSPGIQPQVWASTSHPWKVTLTVLIKETSGFED